MQDSLNSIYLRLDVNMQYLASKAIAQIIIKIVFSNGGSMSAEEIKEQLSKVNDGNRFDDKEIDDILLDLCSNELKKRDGRYYLSTSRKKKLQESIDESEKRQNIILEKYFSGFNSEVAILKEWLSIITRTFFESFSNEWISDLSANTHHVSMSADSIRLQVTRRTESMKEVDNDDKKLLPSRFFEFVNSHDPAVEAYLWGYGTSAFASKLIRNKHGIDKLTMDAFKDSVCILDTNVLLFIALENKYAGSFKAIEKVFQDLNIQPRYLYITRNEYNNKVSSQRDVTISNLEKFGFDTISKSKDDFTSMAVRLRCIERQDFEHFFNYTLALPERIFDKVQIQIMDNDKSLKEAIEKAQEDKSLKDKLNDKYKAVVGRDKSPSACHHDIGLLEGVRYLRNSEEKDKNKFFILSDEISVNQYSKGLGTKNGLPLALRVDTLINMLAVNNGGDTFDASDYKPLFANIIRMGLIPANETFDQLELYQMSQMNTKIQTLPSDQICNIALTMHRNMLAGMTDQDLSRELNILITRGELEVKDEIRDVKAELSRSGKEKQQLSEALQIAESAVRKQVEDEFDNKTKIIKRNFGILLFIGFILLSFVIIFLINRKYQNSNIILTIVTGCISSAIINIISGIIAHKRIIRNRIDNRHSFICDEVNKRLGK